MKEKQDKFKCKHIQCDMDGCYCGLGYGEGYNHCVIPHYKEKCEHFEENTIIRVAKKENSLLTKLI